MAVRWLRTRKAKSLLLASLAVLAAANAVSVQAQAPLSTAGTAVGAPGAGGGIPVSANSGRRLAADAYYVIAPGGEPGDTIEGPVDLPLGAGNDLQWTPSLSPANETLAEMVKSVILRNEVWSLEFSFKPVRMIGVDLPAADGTTKTKVVWYLLYNVRYKGGDLAAKPEKDQFGNDVFQPSPSTGRAERRFVPNFTLNAVALGKRYESRFIPQAIPLIVEKERVGKPVYDSVAIQKVPVKLSTERESHEVWGVATWTDVDPRTDFFSVEVRGLTNAQRVTNNNGQLGTQQKTLILYFSRPGDTINELADTIRYGVPALGDPVQQKMILKKYGLPERLDYQWEYR